MDETEQTQARASLPWRAFVAPAGVLIALATSLFFDVLVLHPEAIASSVHGDGFHYFVRIRELAFAEMATGNIPLWNPYLFGGTPLVGAFQAAVFYPFNLIYLIFPTDQAFDVDLLFHVCLGALLVLAWARSHGQSPWAAFYSAAVLVFGAAFFLRLLAGQASLVAVMAWAPLALMSVDRIIATGRLGWILVGIAAVSLQLLAGYPGGVFVTALAAALYGAPSLWRSERRGRRAVALAAMAVVPLGGAAIQLLPGLETAAEGSRSGGVPFEFATTYSLPPENLLTLLAPAFFGDIVNFTYWGRWWFWDNTVFMGVTGLFLAVHGVFRGGREARRFAWIVLALCLISLGNYLPLYEWLHELVPGFDRFRAPSKFLYPASLFAALLAGFGLDQLRASPRGALILGGASLVLALVAGGAALWLNSDLQTPGTGVLGRTLAGFVGRPGAPEYWFPLIELAPTAGRIAVRSLWIACASLGVVAGLLAARKLTVHAVTLLALFGTVEVFLFAAGHLDSFDSARLSPPRDRSIYAGVAADQRIYEPGALNWGLGERVASVWGYDPVMLGRYAAFMARAHPEFEAPLELVSGLGWDFTPCFPLLRCGVVKRELTVTRMPSPLPRLLLVREYVVVEALEARLDAVVDPDFDPRRTVILESHPDPAPRSSSSRGRITLHELSTDHLSIEVELDAPAVLLITDTYSRGWRARSLSPDAPQARYEVLPANHIQRAIPLVAGHHRLHVEYSPTGYVIGRWISLGTTLGVVAVTGLWWRRRTRPSPP